MQIRFPKNFTWGVATAAAQIEGAAFEDGRGPSIWDAFSRLPGKIKNGVLPDIACNSYHQLERDVEMLKELGVNSYRFSFSWSRILPEGTGKVNEKGGLRTLQNCMQRVFEDGPKRDRRLWIGDLRLQAQANYLTFNNTDLVKRCLYLFAGSTFKDGRVGAAVFTDGEVEVDDTYFGDYALFFISVLYDYYKKTGDMDTLKDLYATAGKQIDLVMELVDDRGVINDIVVQGERSCCFIDWCKGLDKQTAFQGVLIYCTKQMIKLAEAIGDSEKVLSLKEILNKVTDGAVTYLYDETEGLFVSWAERQISTASQVWMILARIFDCEANKKILKKIREKGLPYKMVTPYMVHHYVEALCICKEYEEAKNVIRNYWGKMMALGADTFWEAFDPDDPQQSPYGGTMANSYCHAWSCTPSMLFRVYPLL